MLSNILCCVVALILGADTEEADRTLERVKQEILDKQAQVKSLTAKVETETYLPEELGEDEGDEDMAELAGASVMEVGTLEYLVLEGKTYFREEITTTLQMGKGEGAESEQAKLLTVYDGERLHLESTEEAGTMVREPKASPEDLPTHFLGFEDLAEGPVEWKLADEGMVNGKAAYVLQGQAEGDAPDTGGTLTARYDKETGLMVEFEARDAKGNLMSRRRYSNLRVNPDLSPERFKYTPPANAQREDANE